MCDTSNLGRSFWWWWVLHWGDLGLEVWFSQSLHRGITDTAISHAKGWNTKHSGGYDSYDPSIDPLHPKGGLHVFKVSREAKRFHVVFGWFLWRVVAAISVACSLNWYGATLEPHHRALEMQKGFRQLNRIPFTRCCLPLLPLQSSNERPPSTTKLGSVSFVGSHGQLTLKLDRVPWHHKVIDWSMIQLSIWSKTIIFQAPIASQLEHATSWCPAWYAILSNCYLLSSVNLLLLDIMSIGFSSQDIGM